jgi:hypothetical protein
MIGGNPIRPKRLQAAGIAITLLFIAVCIPQHAPVVAQSAANPSDILIITNKKVVVDSVSQTTIKNLFLKIRKAWDNGEKVLPINPKDERLRNDFRARVLSMSPPAEERYWEELKVKFGQSSPPTFANNQKAVFKLSGSVSYIYRKDYLPNVVKVVLVIPAAGE